MACYTGFGNLADHRPFFTGDFNGNGSSDILFHYPGDHNWWLGTVSGGQLSWSLAGNTAGFGNVADGRPIWTIRIGGRSAILFYYPGDHNWWLGQFSGPRSQLTWALAGNTGGFGQLADGRPIWLADFTGDGVTDVLFYYPGDHNWWLGTFTGTTLGWSLAGNTAGFGQIADGRPIWVSNFNGGAGAEVLFYYPGDKNWWLGSFSGKTLTWGLAGNTAGFGQVWDGRPFFVADFNGDGKNEIIFNFPGDHNWWLGTFSSGHLTWALAGNTAGFGNVADGRPIWVGNFAGSNSADILFYYPGDKNWWLGQFSSAGALSWSLAGNTVGFGQVWDGRPFYVADFNPGGKLDLLFYAPGDGNWWLGSFSGNTLGWGFAGNTGRPGQKRITVHFKSVVPLTTARSAYLDDQYAAMEALYADGGNIATMRGTTEDLSGNANLAALASLNVGTCVSGTTTTDQTTLFANRNNAGANDIVIYLCSTLIGGSGNFVGCAAHPSSEPGCAIVELDTARWLASHEVGHVLGLVHVSNTDRLMNPDVGWTNLPPDIIASEYTTMLSSPLATAC